MRRLPDQIEREIGDAEIDLDARRVTAPFAEALAEDQAVVAEAEEIVEYWMVMALGARVESARARRAFGHVNGGKGSH